MKGPQRIPPRRSERPTPAPLQTSGLRLAARDWIEDLATIRRLSRTTIWRYQHQLERAVAHLERRGWRSWRDVTVIEVHAFLEQLRDDRPALAALRLFHAWLVETERIAPDS